MLKLHEVQPAARPDRSVRYGSIGSFRGCFWGVHDAAVSSHAHADSERPCQTQPIFFMYDVPAQIGITRAVACKTSGGPQGRYEIGESMRRHTPGKVRSTALSDLVCLWSKLRAVPSGAHTRLAQAAEVFARAAVATDDTRWRRQALQSLVRELNRQHAALATRLSRERHACPYTLAARNQVVQVKRLVRSVLQAQGEGIERSGGSEKGTGWGMEGMSGGAVPSCSPANLPLRVCVDYHMADSVEDPLQCLKQFSFVAAERLPATGRTGELSRGAPQTEGAPTSDVSDALYTLHSLRYVAPFICTASPRQQPPPSHQTYLSREPPVVSPSLEQSILQRSALQYESDSPRLLATSDVVGRTALAAVGKGLKAGVSDMCKLKAARSYSDLGASGSGTKVRKIQARVSKHAMQEQGVDVREDRPQGETLKVSCFFVATRAPRDSPHVNITNKRLRNERARMQEADTNAKTQGLRSRFFVESVNQ